MKFSNSFSRLAVCFFLALFLVLPSLAQEAARSTPVLAKADGEPQWSRLEGTLESTVNGITARAKIFVQGPGQMRLEIQRDDAARIAAQTIVVAQNETRLFDPTTRRVQRQPHSVLDLGGWNLQSGGPANFALANFADGLGLPPTGKLEHKPTGSFVNDFVRFGGSGDRIFYAPFKRMQWDGPARVLLEWSGAGPVQTRTEFNEAGRVLSRATLTYTNTGIPTGAVVVDAKNRPLAEFRYTLAERAEPFPAETFSFDFAGAQIVEDAQTKAIGEYSGADASSKFNRGVALMRQSEELPAAYAAWEEAAAVAPTATAPHFAIYEAALASRDLTRADAALSQLGALLGADSFPVVWARAGVLLARRDWAGAQTALETAAKLEPQNLQAKLSLADVLRSRGNIAGAQSQLLEVLKNDLPQNATQAQAAQMLAELASGKAGAGVLTALGAASAQETLWQKVARAAIELRHGRKAAPVETENLEALATLAQEFERAGQDNDALAAWQKIIDRAPWPADQVARVHLMSLFARRGDASSSLAQYRELIAATTDMKTKRAWQDQLIAAWTKAFRQEQLKTVLEQRSIATNATEDDVQLWLAYQESFGTSEDVLSAIQNGLARFTREAWWRARHSEYLMEQAARSTDNATLERIQRDALEVAETAVALDPAQPYYAVQHAMILTQRATPVRGVLESGRFDGAKKTAREALDALLKKWPNDADVQIAVASQRLALEDDGAHDDSIALLQAALRGGEPRAGEDRHFIAFSSRQVLISALRRSRKWNAITPQYEILFKVSRTGEEQLGVALNYLRLLMNREEPDAIAGLLVYFARESWPFEESQQILLPLVNVVAVRDSILAPALLSLQKSSDPYSRLVLAKIYSNRARAAKAVLAAPNAPDRAERDVIAAETNLKTAIGLLEPLVDSGDKILAARAAATLGEEAMNRNAPQEAEKWLARAVALEPRDINLRVALATSLLAQNKIPETLAVRDDILRVLPASFENLHRAAKLSSRAGDANDREFAARLAAQAGNVGAVSPAILPAAWQLAMFTVARTAFDAEQTNAAVTTYNNLAGTQWGLVERAVALIDLEESFRLAGRNEPAATAAARLEALGLTPQQRQRAEEIWEHLGD